MKLAVDIHLDGLDTELKKISQNFNSRLNYSIKKCIYMVRNDMIQRVPVRTGNLKRSHKTIFNDLEGTIEVQAKYGYFVHEGTKYIKGNPWATSAFYKRQQEIENILDHEVDVLIQKIK